MNGPTISTQAPTPDAKLAAMQGVPNRPASSLRPCFVEASPTVENAVPVMLESGPTRSLVAKLPREFRAANYKNATNEATDGCVQNFDAGCRGA